MYIYILYPMPQRKAMEVSPFFPVAPSLQAGAIVVAAEPSVPKLPSDYDALKKKGLVRKRRGRPWEVGKSLGKPWEKHEKLEKPWENHGTTVEKL